MATPRKLPLVKQYAIGMLVVLVSALACFLAKNWLNYRIVALILLMTVSALAMLLEIRPVLLAAALSAVTWNFFFIPPVFTFNIGNAEDLLMFLLYFVIALVNAVLTHKIREAERKVRDKEEKEKEVRLYNTLLNALSHELRTPIAAIIGSVDALKENRNRLSADSQNELLNEISMAGLRLNRQVENMLNMSRLESGMLKPAFDWCDMNEQVYTVIQKIAAGNSEIVFVPDETLPLLRLDAGLTEQIIENLVRNALQHNSGKVIVKVHINYRHGRCILVVGDNGTGFPEEEITAVFDKFYRLKGTKAGGSGLGLSIVKGFTEAMGGTVTLENASGGGAIFTIDIPAEASYINNLKNE